METNKKERYLSPEVKSFEVKAEGVICTSGELTLDYETPFEGDELVW